MKRESGVKGWVKTHNQSFRN